MNDRLMTIEELADFLRIPKGTLYQWRHRGRGPSGVRVGRFVRYRPADVEAWLEAQARQPA